MNNEAIDELTGALLREYLVSKKLEKSFQVFNIEKPKLSDAYNKRTSIIKTLNINQLIVKNKEQKKPLPSILEVIVKNLVDGSQRYGGDFVEGSKSVDRALPIDKTLKGILIKDSPKQRCTAGKKNQLHFSDEYIHHPCCQNMDVVSTSSLTYPNSNNLNISKMSMNNFDDMDYEDTVVDNCRQKKHKRLSKSSVEEDMCIADIEDDDDDDYTDLGHLSCSAAMAFDKQLPGTPISRNKAKELRSLIFGTTAKNFNHEWKAQNFKFSAHPDVVYGLIQKKAGPCGIIASVQSYIIRELLYPKVGDAVGLNPTPVELDSALKLAICGILWKIGQGKMAILAIFNTRQVSKGSSDKNPESLVLLECPSLFTLESCVDRHLDTFKREDRGGCICLLYSAILSRGIENVRSDMDEPNGHLIGVHGYCTLEMVNLFLIGRAHSNVFDGIIKLDSGGDELSVLHGVTSQSDIGFLSLFEHYNSCKVGLHMKNPVYPIWVVCSESHFTVLFSMDTDLVGPEKQHPKIFELIYYDSLGNNDDEIRLQLVAFEISSYMITVIKGWSVKVKTNVVCFECLYLIGRKMILALLFTLVTGSAAQLILVQGDGEGLNNHHFPSPRIVCYFSGWANKRPGIGNFNADSIDPFSCTHFIYAFAGLNSETYTIESLGDEEEYIKFIQLKRKNPAAKVMIALGGWAEGGKKYSVMARVPERRALFVATALDFLQRHGFDGMDLDWEYPGAIDRDGVPEDKQNFIELIKEMYQAFYNRGYLLSAAITPAKVRVDMGYNIKEMNKYLDFINVMTYDLHGSWEGYADHHSRLFRRPHDEGGYEHMNADFGIRYLLKKGAQRTKLVMGLPFYGRSFTLIAKPENKTQIGRIINRGDPGNYTEEPGFLSYYEICPNLKDEQWVKEKDEFAAVPYMYRGDQWIGYDDEESIALKSSYIRSHGLGGAMIWAIDLDDFRGICGKKWPLISKVNEILWSGVSGGPTRFHPQNHPINGHAFMSPPSQISHGINTFPGLHDQFFPQRHPLHQQFLPGPRNPNPSPMHRDGMRVPFFIQNAHDGALMQGLGHPAIEMQSLKRIAACKDDYIFKDLDNCNSFYQCAGGFLRHLVCPGGLKFKEATQACENPNRVVCVNYQEDTWTCPGDGWYRDPKSCSHFYWCHGDTFNHIACPPGTYFNVVQKACFHMKDVDCEVPVENELTTETVKETTTTVVPVTQAVTEASTQTTQRVTTTRVTPSTQSSTQSVASSTVWDWRPTTSRPTDKPGTIPPSLSDDYKVVCYFTNWAWYRPGDGKFYPEDTDISLCTHIIYAFTVLHPETLTVKAHDPWADIDNDFFRRLVRLKERKPNLKVLVGLGGWNDSQGDKYSRLVNNPNARRRFIAHALAFIKEYKFDGIDLDWEYPKCWQVDCKKGPESDKQSFTAWVREIRQAFDSEGSGLLLSAAVSPSKMVINQGYEVAELAQLFDFISIMTYDFHGSWEKFTGHNAPLYYFPGDEFDYFNANFSVHYWMQLGTPREKLIMGVPAYGQTWTLIDSNQHGMNSNASGPGEAGIYSRQGGMLAYYEICEKLRTGSWTVVKDPLGRIGPYAFRGNQWVSFDDVETIKRKAEFIKSLKLGGAMIWALDFDDFRNRCCTEENPLLKTLNRVLRNYPAGPTAYTGPCTRSPDPGPFIQYSDHNSHSQGHVVRNQPNVCITSRCLT
uniref:chitinase n=1 Tax=Strigamia maritima TaxID=126957 RepID=T1JB05_STRMM